MLLVLGVVPRLLTSGLARDLVFKGELTVGPHRSVLRSLWARASISLGDSLLLATYNIGRHYSSPLSGARMASFAARLVLVTDFLELVNVRLEVRVAGGGATGRVSRVVGAILEVRLSVGDASVALGSSSFYCHP